MRRNTLIVIVVGVLGAPVARAQWTPVAAFPDAAARTDGAGLSHGGLLYVIGGLPLAGNQTPVQYLDPNVGTWQAGPSAEDAIVRQGAGVDSLGRIVVFGGVNGIDPEEDPGSTYQYDLEEGQWTGLADRSAAAPIERFAWATDDQGRIYSFGGGAGAAAGTGNPNSAYVERYVAASDTWEAVAPLPVAVADAAAVNDGRGHLLVFGGINADATARLATVQQYDVAADTWSLAVPAMPAALSGHEAVTGADGRVYVLGGASGAIGAGVTQAAVHVLHLDTLTWSVGPSMAVPRRDFAAALWDDDSIYALGGANDAGGTNSVESLFTPTCPTITLQPVAQVAWPETAAGFSVAAAGTEPFSFQWYKDAVALADGPTASGSIVSGSTSDALLISGPVAADAGSYHVEVTNNCGTTASVVVDLSVRTPVPIPTNWEAVGIHPGWAQMSSSARGVSNGWIGGAATTPTLMPDGRTLNLSHPVVWDTANLVPIDVTPAGSVGGEIHDVEGDLLVGWFWHTWSCPGGGQTWTCAWQSAAFWTAPNFSFEEALHNSGPEYDAAYGTDGVAIAGTLTYEYTEGNYDSKAHLWSSPTAQRSLHPAGMNDSGASAVDGAFQYGWSRVGLTSDHATMWQGTPESFVDLHPAGYARSSILGAGDGQAVGSVDSQAGLWVPPSGFINLHPAGASSSQAVAAHDGVQMGHVEYHAALWSGTADSLLDLHSAVPATFSSSYAEDFEVQPDGSMIVVGTGYNTATGRNEAIVWRGTFGTPGDADGDGDVDLTDLALVLSDFGCASPPASTCPGDTDGDGDTDLADLALLLANFGQ